MDPRARQDALKARKLFQSGDYAAAIPAFERAIKKMPRDASLLHQLGVARGQLGDLRGAVRSIQKALSIKPSTTLYLVDLGQFCAAEGRYDEAERAFDRALRVDPELAFAMGAKVELYQLVGRFDEARELAETAMRDHPGDVRLAVAYAKLAPRIEAEEPAIAALERVLQTDLKPGAEAIVRFRLANLLDRTGAHDRAFDAARRANSLVPARFDPAAHAASIDRMIAAWTPEAIASMPRASRETDLPIFIVGMLRSGTSLVEQILSCHPQVFGGDELTTIGTLCARLRGPFPTHEPRLDDPSVLTKARLDQAQREYLGTLYKMGGKASRVTDKMPSNFAHLGLISRMLPGARVIHCVRDPLDTCISCWFQHFQGTNPWCYRAEWMGAYWRDYRRLMDHWSVVLTDLPLLEVVYEDLTGDPETWIPRIVEFAGLEWDESCLRFHESDRVSRTVSNEQVRRPMYRSAVGRHRNYAEHLGPLRAALGIGE